MLLNNDKDVKDSSKKSFKVPNINKKVDASSNTEMMEVIGMMEMNGDNGADGDDGDDGDGWR